MDISRETQRWINLLCMTAYAGNTTLNYLSNHIACDPSDYSIEEYEGYIAVYTDEALKELFKASGLEDKGYTLHKALEIGCSEHIEEGIKSLISEGKWALKKTT